MQETGALYQFDGVLAEKTIYVPGTLMSRHRDVFPKISILMDGSFSEKTDNATMHIEGSGLVIKLNTVFHENSFGKKGATILSITFVNQELAPSFLNNWDAFAHPYFSVLGIKAWAQLRKVKNELELNQLLTDLKRQIETFQGVARTTNPKMKEAEKLLAELKLTSKKIEEIAHDLSFHRAYFSRAFKKYFNVSPQEYGKYARLLKAVSLLLHTKTSLASVAYEAGFSDQSHFNRHLKEAVGCTPLQLRELFNS